MPATEYIEWQAYFSIFPFSEDRQDRRNAQLCAVIANISGKSLKRDVSADTFMPHYLEAPRARTPSIEQQAKEFAAFHSKFKSVSVTHNKL